MSGPIKVAVAGHRGEVGSICAAAVAAEPDIESVGGVGAGDVLGAFLGEKRPEAVVDFTRPAVALHHALVAIAAGAAPVVGTTGIAADGIDRIEAACKEKRLGGIVPPNFPIGPALILHLPQTPPPPSPPPHVVP